ncbi:P-loop containing nucleoside triphosphate hydrolase protein [Xylaria bambusicola]|uniref:P-loop containing nucleoside triphosphate hydrolase protein n=1 Tax=Xylaria bambusicola TaxID=326684 RepID=UPI0020079136|nr:P-loop containing nucleoside triphosphate hydrolase protein [Xylaria bambusicola]KAI0509603.1 P-loop containing nucleoside triphosphate hydrolase protein [Xylaria bambusicola]
MPLRPNPRWLLLSDIHFQVRDLERIKRTAEWIVTFTRQTPGISRVIICGDVLTSRSMQPTAVISAAYRFLSDLSSSVPHVNVILGNHDLAYRRDYSTTALEALNMSRLKPFISLHDGVNKYNWDGRDVLVLPFREDQTELTAAVANVNSNEAAHTVAFAHLALNRAVTQRHVVYSDTTKTGYSIRYRGTFTGHFHSHQTIIQPERDASPASSEGRLQGSVTYLGSPLQLTWADLCDEERGVVLLDPVTLEHELIANPHAVGYITVQGPEVLDEKIDASTVQGKHVMMLGGLTRFQYWTARDKLLSFGAQSVRESRPAPTSQGDANSFVYHGLGTSIPESDRGVSLKSTEPLEIYPPLADELNTPPQPDDLPSVKIDPVESESMDREKLIQLGQRLMIASEDATAFPEENAAYKLLLDPSHSIATQDVSQAPTKQVFVAKPRSIKISNFLGIQDEFTIDFDGDMGKGLSFVVGSNGSGKSTLIEAIVWCQFGRCIRKGLSVGDVVNDITGQNCMVSLSFSNGYTISRFRKHKVHGNRVIVSLNGVEQPQFEHGEARATQAAIDELLGIEYEEFIKAVVLGHESAASFLSSTPAQRQDFIESTLGLSTLDRSADLSRRMLREIDDECTGLRSQIDAIEQSMYPIQRRIENGEKELRRLRLEEEEAKRAISRVQSPTRNETSDGNSKDDRAHHTFDRYPNTLNLKLEELKSKVKQSQQAVNEARSTLKNAENWDKLAAKQRPSVQITHQPNSQYQTLRDELLRLSSRQRDSKIMEHIHSFESTIGHISQAVSWLQSHATKATKWVGSANPVNRAALHFIRIGLMTFGRLSSHLNSLLGPLTSSIARQQQENVDAIQNIVKTLGAAFPQEKEKTAKLPKRDDKSDIIRSPDKKLSEPKITLEEARQQLSYSLNHLSELLEEQGVLHEIQAKQQREITRMNEGTRKREGLINKLAEKKREIEIYQKMITEETSILQEQSSSHASLVADVESVASTRELFAFWESSLSRRRLKSATAPTFRGYMFDKSLQELNTVASSILLVLYENTRHARELTKGMLRTIIASDPEYDQDPKNSQGTGLLDQGLGVTKTLSYAKRSGGERKRIDLAVFFALVQILQANSRHRARYILIDEAFDSLDVAGQAAVVRWCSQLTSRMDFQLVVTHSDYLISSARSPLSDDDGGELQSQFSVLSATMTKEGTKFTYTIA